MQDVEDNLENSMRKKRKAKLIFISVWKQVWGRLAKQISLADRGFDVNKELWIANKFDSKQERELKIMIARSVQCQWRMNGTTRQKTT